MIWALALCVFSLVLQGCRPKRPSQYVERAYSEQQALKAQKDPTPHLNELSSQDLLVDLDAFQEKQWARRPYESLDEWVTRIQSLLELNQDAIRFAQAEFEDLEERQLRATAQLSDLIRKNDEMRRLISKPLEEQARERDKVGLVVEGDFTMHLVREGETLFSIAMNKYESADMVKEIAMWNQGWIRHPDEVIAGLALVLFPEEAQDKQVRVVEQYLEKLRGTK